MNLDCLWPPEDAFRIDLENPVHIRHLLSDIEVADELTIRCRNEMGAEAPDPFSAFNSEPEEAHVQVTIPVLLLYGLLAPWGVRRVRSRFADDEPVARGVPLLVVSMGNW